MQTSEKEFCTGLIEIQSPTSEQLYARCTSYFEKGNYNGVLRVSEQLHQKVLLVEPTQQDFFLKIAGAFY
jgi:hypothetical protein